MLCPQLEIFPLTINQFADADGRVLLDTWEQTSLSINRSLEKFEEILTNERPEPIVLSLPNTPKNFYYLKHLYDPATYYGNDVSIKVRISSGSDTFTHDLLFGLTKSSSEFEVKLVLADDSGWIDLLKNTKLKDIDLPQVSFTKEDVDDKWLNNKLYLDNDPGYWYPVVFYGNWRARPRRLTVEDLRPFLHATFLLQKMFEYIGWCFRSPFYETNFARSLNCYLLKKDYGNTLEQQRLRLFYAGIVFPEGTVIQINHAILIDWTEFFDYGNNFDPVTGIYGNGFEGKFKLKVIMGEYLFPFNFYFSIIKRRFNPITNQFEYEVLNQETWVAHSWPTQELTFNFEVDVNILPDEEVYASINVETSESEYELPFKIEIYFWNEVTRSFPAKGDTIDLKKEVDEEMTCLDLFRAFQHLINGIVEFDVLDKTVTLYTPYDANIFGETIVGYYNNTFVDLIILQPPNTTQSELGDPDKLRYVRLAFAKSTDALFEKKTRPDGTEYYSKTIDLGAYYKNDTQEDRNPIFEGTELYKDILPGINSFGNHQPFEANFPSMVDNEDSEISYDIQPRILYNVGFVHPDSAGLFNYYRWEDEYLYNLAFACQKPDNLTFNNGTIILERLVYGDEENDLWSMIYGKFYLQYNGRIKLNVLAYLDNNRFLGIDFRNVFQVEMDGHPIMGRILTISDYRPCEVISTPLLLMPELVSDPCFDSTPEFVCNNNPSIIAEVDDCCFNLSIGGTFNCVIENIIWEQNVGGNWVEFDQGSTAQICDLSEVTIIRATVSYDCECEDSIITKTLNPCFNTLACRLTQFTNETNQICVQWELLGDAICGYTLESVVINGGTYVDFVLTDPYLICGLEEDTDYIFTAVITFPNCEGIELECEINTGDIECENFPVLECVPITVDGITCFTWIVTGEMSSDVETFIVTWNCDGVIGTWLPGDDPICCSGTITASALVFFCDCPTICTEDVSCEGSGCTVVSPGTPINFLACN